MPTEIHHVIRRFVGHPEVKVIKCESTQFLMSMPPGHLDWVYLDTNHQEEQTRKELQAATFAVKKGGLIMGHDFSPQFIGVVRAVQDFCNELGIKPEIWDSDRLPSFKIQI